jgi:hypothetical protein
MKLRQKSKRDQALDAVASIAKTWSEWHLGKRVSKTAAKSAKQASKLKDTGKGTRLKIAAAVALVGGAGAAVAAKLKGGKAEPAYTPPGPAADMPDPPPSPVVVEDLAGEPAAAAEPPDPPATSIVVEDLATEAAAEPAPDDADEPADPGASAVPDPGAPDEEPAKESADKA